VATYRVLASNTTIPSSSSTGSVVLSSSSTGPVVLSSSSTGSAANGNNTTPGIEQANVARLSHIALGLSAALIAIAAVLACIFRKRCSAGAPMSEQPHTVPHGAHYVSMQQK